MAGRAMRYRRLFPVLFGGGSKPIPKQIDGLYAWYTADTISGLADADAVTTWYDQSGNGRNATGSEAARPSYKTNVINGLPVVRFAGSHAMQTAALDWSAYNQVTVFVVAKKSSAATQIILESSDNFNNHTGVVALFETSGVPYWHASGDGGSATNFLHATNFSAQPVSLSMTSDLTVTTNENTIWMNGVTAGSRSSNGNNSGRVFGNYVLNIGSRNAASVFFNGDIAEIIIYSTLLSTTDRQKIEAYLNTKYLLDYYVVPGDFTDNAYTTPTYDGTALRYYLKASCGSRLVYQTTASTMTIETYCSLGDYATWRHIGLSVNGVDQTPVSCDLGWQTQTVSLGVAGVAKTVILSLGLQASGASRYGTFVTGVGFNSSLSKPTQTTTPRILVYGDSIAVGGNSTNPETDGWVALVRAAYTGSVMYEATGGRALKTDCTDAAARTTFAAWIAAQTPTIVWLAIGVNDYGGDAWSAADFGTAYADLLDKLHTALPSAVIYAQTPIDRGSEVANSFGNTLGDYRTQIASAQSTRSEYCTLVDGTAINPELADGVHPTTAGHVTYATYAKTVLGIV